GGSGPAAAGHHDGAHDGRWANPDGTRTRRRRGDSRAHGDHGGRGAVRPHAADARGDSDAVLPVHPAPRRGAAGDRPAALTAAGTGGKMNTRLTETVRPTYERLSATSFFRPL